MENEPFSIPGGEDLTVKHNNFTGKEARIIFNDDLLRGALEVIRKTRSDIDNVILIFASGSSSGLMEPDRGVAWRSLIAPMIPQISVKVNHVGNLENVRHNSKFETEITCCGVKLVVEADQGVRTRINPGATFRQFGEVTLDLPEDNFHVVRDGLNAMKISAFDEWSFHVCATAEPNP